MKEQHADQLKSAVEGLHATRKELEKYKEAVRVVVDMVDPPEGGARNAQQLQSCLRDAPQKISNFIVESSKDIVTHVLGLIKSYWPQSDLSPVADGAAADCTDEQFEAYRQEVRPVAHKIVESLEQE